MDVPLKSRWIMSWWFAFVTLKRSEKGVLISQFSFKCILMMTLYLCYCYCHLNFILPKYVLIIFLFCIFPQIHFFLNPFSGAKVSNSSWICPQIKVLLYFSLHFSGREDSLSHLHSPMTNISQPIYILIQQMYIKNFVQAMFER